jgi:hypothetical protein
MIRSATQWGEEYGIAKMHWEDFEQIASSKNAILIVRGGKKATIKFIEMNFPGKPPELKFLKTSAQSGLLEVDTSPGKSDEWSQVFAAGHFVLARPRKDSERLFAVGPVRGVRREEFEVPYSKEKWARPGLAVDSKTKLPFTSDYDLGAVIDAGDHRFGKTFLGVIEGEGKRTSADSAKPRLRIVQGGGQMTRSFAPPVVEKPQKPLDMDYTNPWVKGIMDALNARMVAHRFSNKYSSGPGLTRVLHGAVSNWSGNPAIGSEDLIVFYPGGRVEKSKGSTLQNAHKHLHEILRSTPAARGS